MCRIAGGIDFAEKTITENVLNAMRDSLSFGGPDSAGSFIDEDICLSQRRLSIIDLSDAGFQPMVSGKWVITYNGEIYNYKEIKQKLSESGCNFETNSDTEVIIKAFEIWGKEAVHHFRGMFAFALWDKEEKKLLLCRDRLGVKPLFWYFKDNVFLFASEIKAFHEHPLFDKSLDLSGLPHYLSKGYFHESDCIFKFVRKVAPGSFLEINRSKEIRTWQYWNVESIYANAKLDNRDIDEIAEELESILLESFSLRMVADVDVGIFLSGGVDSSLVTALLQKNSTRALHTFTIGFEDIKYNEAEVANKIATELGTNHSMLICTETEFRTIIPDLPFFYDEPFGDSSAIPTHLVSRLASKSVKVALSGDGGDELFGGYSKYKFTKHASSILSIPYPIRKFSNSISLKIDPKTVASVFSMLGLKSYTQVDTKYLKFRQTLLAKDVEDFFEKASSYLSTADLGKLTHIESMHDRSGVPLHLEKLIGFLGMKDMTSYLPGDILTKVDRASMHIALETREPFLDPEVIKFAFTIPDKYKISPEGESKFILKKILSKHISHDIINRPKQGFSVPIADWLKGFLKEEILSLSNDEVFFETFNLNQTFFNKIIDSFFANKGTYNPHFIWFIYSLYKWYKKWI